MARSKTVKQSPADYSNIINFVVVFAIGHFSQGNVVIVLYDVLFVHQ